MCKLQWGGLDIVAGGNLSATLPMAIRGLRWGQVFWKVSAHGKNESAQQRPLHTCTHTHTFTFSLSLLFFVHFCLSLLSPLLYDFLSLIREQMQVTLCPYAIFHLVLLLIFLDALFYLFALTFLFKPAHMPSFTQLVTSLPVNVQKQHLSP